MSPHVVYTLTIAISITWPQCFTISRRLNRPVRCGNAELRVSKAVYRGGICDKHANCPRWHSIPGSRAPPPGTLPLDGCDLQCIASELSETLKSLSLLLSAMTSDTRRQTGVHSGAVALAGVQYYLAQLSSEWIIACRH